MNVIRSHCHEIYTEKINKIALSSDDENELLWLIEYTLWLMYKLKKIVIKNEFIYFIYLFKKPA